MYMHGSASPHTREWGYVVLDEGHKIRNPDAHITLACKRLLTTHRIILSGAPIQNKLKELWSLFDFVFPGKLGTLPVFEQEFCWPINQGGYTNASSVQVQMSYKCALVLRDLINPYILRRTKKSVALSLPKKTEQILFCNLAPAQEQQYAKYLRSKEVMAAVDGRLSLFKAISVLRKLCNHPDLLLLESRTPGQGQGGGRGKGRDWRGNPVSSKALKKVPPPDMHDYGAVERSGKIQVLQQVLRMWKRQGHRVLLFSQTRQVLDILVSTGMNQYMLACMRTRMYICV